MAPKRVVAAYILVTLAALLRVAVPMLDPQHALTALTLAGLAWLSAFALFAFYYTPILVTPRSHSKVA